MGGRIDAESRSMQESGERKAAGSQEGTEQQQRGGGMSSGGQEIAARVRQRGVQVADSWIAR